MSLSTVPAAACLYLQCLLRVCIYNACYVSVSTMPAACLYLQCLLRVCIYNACCCMSVSTVPAAACLYLQCLLRVCIYNACYVSVSTVPAAACLYLQCLLRVFVHKVCSTEDWLILTGTRSRERNVRRSSLYTGPPLHTLAHPQYIIVHRLI